MRESERGGKRKRKEREREREEKEVVRFENLFKLFKHIPSISNG